MLEEYEWEVLKNSAKNPCLNGFFSSRVCKVREILKTNNFDAAILTGWHSFSLIQALLAFKRLGVKCMVRGDSNALRPRSQIVRFIHRVFLSLYNGFLAVGSSNREFYLQNGINPELIFDCPHFVDNARFSREALSFRNKKYEIRDSWRIPKRGTCFLYAGKLVEKKRIHDLLRAFQLAGNCDSTSSLLVVGSGQLMQSARQFAQNAGLQVIFTGFLNQTQIAQAYAAADCLVLPSDYGETWGLVVNEAMVCGLPAIVSDRVGCGPDLVEEGITGSVFPFGNIDALAEKMVEMASDPQRMAQLGKRAQERVLREYSVERAVEGTLKAIEVVLRHRG